MTSTVKPIRIEPAFENRERIRAMFEQHAPYRAIAAYAPEGLLDEKNERAVRPVLPWFRGDWALGGEPLVEGADLILHNKKIIRLSCTVGLRVFVCENLSFHGEYAPATM